MLGVAWMMDESTLLRNPLGSLMLSGAPGWAGGCCCGCPCDGAAGAAGDAGDAGAAGADGLAGAAGAAGADGAGTAGADGAAGDAPVGSAGDAGAAGDASEGAAEPGPMMVWMMLVTTVVNCCGGAGAAGAGAGRGTAGSCFWAFAVGQDALVG